MRSIVVIGVLTVLALAGGCRRAPEMPAVKNVVLISIGSLRADHLGCYGYARATSPFIDGLAREGVRFAEARAHSSSTRESVATLFTGRFPSRGGTVGWDAHPPPSAATLGRLFERAGYATGFFSATAMLTHAGFTQGFQTVRQLDGEGGPALSAEAVAFARRAGAQPFLLYLHFLDPHGPYADGRPRPAELVASGVGPGEARFDDMVARYDAEIAATDAAIAALFAGLRELGVLERTMVVITADHGEELFEHGFVEHAWTLYDEVLRVPLIFWPASAVPGLRAERRAGAVDVLPTLAAMAGLPDRLTDIDGRSLFAEGERPFIGELVIPERNVIRTVITDRWKYVAAAKWLPVGERAAAARVENDLRAHGGDRSFDPCGAPVHEELFDLVSDPGEQRDLLAAQPGRLELLRALLGPALMACREHAPPPAEPAGRSGAERLRAPGDVD